MFYDFEFYLMLFLFRIKHYLTTLLIEIRYFNYGIILVPYGLGETTLVCLMSKEFKRKYNNRKVAIVVKNKSTADYTKMYEDVDAAIPTSTEYILRMLKIPYQYTQNKKGKIFNLALGYKNGKAYYKPPLTLFEGHKNNMGLCGNYEHSKLYIDPNKCKQLKAKYHLEKPTVLLFPEAVALNYKCLEPKFWNNLAYIYEKRGYQVFINSRQTNLYGNHKYIYEDVYETILVATMSKYVVAFRAGILDTMAPNIDTKIIALFPSLDFDIYSFGSNEYMKKIYFKFDSDAELERIGINSQSLNKMFDIDKIVELIVRKNHENELLEDILKNTIDGE